MRILLKTAVAAAAVHGAVGSDVDANNIYDAASMPDGVVHFPLTKRSLSERIELFRRDSDVDVPLKNTISSFTATLGIGSNNQSVTVLVDTGSSDLWVMSSQNPYCSSVSNSNSQDDSQSTSSSSQDKIKCYRDTMFDPTKSDSFTVNTTSLHITYGDGTFANGSYCQDTITYGSATIKHANFALANMSDSSSSVWGIGLPGLESTVSTYDESGNFSPTYSNLPAQMKQQGLIEWVAYSLWLNSVEASSGTLLFGGVDHAQYNGTLQTIPLLSTYSGAKPNEFQVKLDSIKLYQGSNSASIVECSFPALLDSGTTYMMLPRPFLEVIVGSIGGVCQSRGCFAPCNLEGGLTFGFSGIEIEVPFSQFEFNVGSNSACLLGMLPSDNIILGDTFLRSAYVVYDLQNYEVALAGTNYNATSSSIEAITNGIPSATQAPSYSSTNLQFAYTTSYATFFTTGNGATVPVSGSAGSGGASTSEGSFSGGGGIGPLGSGFFTSAGQSSGGGSGGSSTSRSRNAKNGAGSSYADNSSIFVSLFTSAFSLLLYL